jgi:hypothetical protein
MWIFTSHFIFPTCTQNYVYGEYLERTARYETGTSKTSYRHAMIKIPRQILTAFECELKQVYCAEDRQTAGTWNIQLFHWTLPEKCGTGDRVQEGNKEFEKGGRD